MTYKRPDSHLPEDVENDILAHDWIKHTRSVMAIAMVETMLDGILGFPILHRLLAYTEAIFKLFWSN